MLSLFMYIALANVIDGVTVTRAKQDVFTAPDIPGKLCQNFGGYWDTATSCKCSWQTNTFYATLSTNYECLLPTKECKLDVTNPLITADRTMDQTIPIKNCFNCNTIKKVYLWNLKSTTDKKGTWIDVTKMTTPYVEFRNNLIFYSSRLNNNLWKGQLMKITFKQSKDCLLLKVAGDINYPFDVSRLFLLPTQKPTTTAEATTTTKGTTTTTTTATGIISKTQPTTVKQTTTTAVKPSPTTTEKLTTTPMTSTTKSATSDQSKHTTTTLSETSTKYQTTPLSTEPNSNNGAIQHNSGTLFLPSWVIPVIVVLVLLVLLLLVIVLWMCRKQLHGKIKEKRKTLYGKAQYINSNDVSNGDNKRFSREGVDNAIYLSADENRNIELKSNVNIGMEYLYEQPEQHTYMYSTPNDIKKSSATAPNSNKQKSMTQAISKSQLIASDYEAVTHQQKQEDYAELENCYRSLEEYSDLDNLTQKREDYAQLNNFNKDVYAEMAPQPGSYVSLKDKFCEEFGKPNTSVRI